MPKKTFFPTKNFSAQRFVKKSKSTLQKMPSPTLFYTSFGIVILSFTIALLSQSILPPEIPLYYGLAEGQERLGSSSSLAIPSAVSLLIIFINTSIALIIKNKFIQQTLIFASFVVSLFSLITILKIIFLVGSLQI